MLVNIVIVAIDFFSICRGRGTTITNYHEYYNWTGLGLWMLLARLQSL